MMGRKQKLIDGYEVDCIYARKRYCYLRNNTKTVAAIKRKMNKRYRKQLKEELQQEVDMDYEASRKAAQQIHENLIQATDKPAPPLDITKTMECVWNDGQVKKIMIGPDVELSGIHISFYTGGLHTARLAMSTQAAIHLYNGLYDILFTDRGLLDQYRRDHEINSDVCI